MGRLNEGGFVAAQNVSYNLYHLANCLFFKPVIRLIFGGGFFGKLNGFSLASIATRISSPCAHKMARISASASALTHNSSASSTCPRKLLESARRESIASCNLSLDEVNQKLKSPRSMGMRNCPAIKTVSNGASGLEVMVLLPRRKAA